MVRAREGTRDAAKEDEKAGEENLKAEKVRVHVVPIDVVEGTRAGCRATGLRDRKEDELEEGFAFKNPFGSVGRPIEKGSRPISQGVASVDENHKDDGHAAAEIDLENAFLLLLGAQGQTHGKGRRFHGRTSFPFFSLGGTSSRLLRTMMPLEAFLFRRKARKALGLAFLANRRQR